MQDPDNPKRPSVPHTPIPPTMHSDADAAVSTNDAAEQRSSTLDFDSDRPSEPPASPAMHDDAEGDMFTDTAEPAAGPSSVNTVRERAKAKLSFPTKADEEMLLARHRSRPDYLSEMRQYTKKMEEDIKHSKKADAILSTEIDKLTKRLQAGIDDTARAQASLGHLERYIKEDEKRFSKQEATMQSHLAQFRKWQRDAEQNRAEAQESAAAPSWLAGHIRRRSRSAYIDPSHAEASDRDNVMEDDPILGEDPAVEKAKGKGKGKARTSDMDNVIENDPVLGADQAVEEAEAEARISDRDSVTPATKSGGRKKVPKRVPPLPIVVRDQADQGWTTTASLEMATRRMLEIANSRLASGANNKAEEYARFVRANNLSGDCCVNCQVILHKKSACQLNDGNTACGECMKNFRPCGKLIEHNGRAVLAWLPLPAAEREGLEWKDKGYWTKH
ncbi:hypothetical protein IQ07DRAFT_654672 [Pyrenochaeta sp. DS3sAY3a]|nr:hypothetical protein IQ07DRAFT_654672 [Pyrenochaeta sp. DS3sAY3a]